jgi:hypothetical protein
MAHLERRVAYVSLWVLALAFGVIEAAAVVYLREIYLREATLRGPADFAGLHITLVSLPTDLVSLEMVREACTIALLGAVAWLAGRRVADRFGAFLLAFGIWDVSYYGALKLASDWPESLGTWDILFLIPLPWVAPVWAPMTVATLFAMAGSYLYWTPERQRRYHWLDVAVLVTSVLLTLAAFLVETRAVIDHRVPERFPAWLFWAGVLLGSGWFLRVEGRAAAAPGGQPWLGVRVRTIFPTPSRPAPVERREATSGDGTVRRGREEGDVGRVIWEYTEARRRLHSLMHDAAELGERFEHLAHGLTAHPRRMIIGHAVPFGDEPAEWDVVAEHPLPPIESLAALTNQIRQAASSVDELRERLLLMGRADVVEQPDGFFH